MSTEPYERKESYSFFDMLRDTFGGGSGHSSSSDNHSRSEDDSDNNGDSGFQSANDWDFSQFEGNSSKE